MTKITAPQITTATCCVLGSDMRGTFKAREMVANERIPSINSSARVPASFLEETYTLQQQSAFQDHIG